MMMIKVLEESKSKVVRGESDEENNPSICMTCPKVVCVKGKETKKTTALRIPAWSPTVVLTERHSG